MQNGHFYETQDSSLGKENYNATKYQVEQDISNMLWDTGHFDAGVTSVQSTFLTPSALRLAELEAKGQGQTPVTENNSGDEEVRVESASKARRRAMAKSIGFTPTDP